MQVETKNETSKGRSILQLKHQRQKYNWDCGLSCVLMVLTEEQRREFLLNFNKICGEEGFDKSTWTIDLCYLLRRFSTRHKLCTVTLGVQPGYTGQAFYSKILSKDQGRVTLRFAEAKQRGVEVEERSLGHEELLAHLSRWGPVILLTNANLLHCDICKANRLSAELRSCLPWAASYQGHYIVLCGFDLSKRVFFYRNPSFSDRVCAMNFTSMDEARVSFGTDEDAILVFSSHVSSSGSLS